MKIEISEDVVWRELGGEVVILDLATNHYFGLTGSGNDIWRLIAEYGSTDKALSELNDAYDGVDPEKLREDFEKFVNELSQKGMLRVSAAENG